MGVIYTEVSENYLVVLIPIRVGIDLEDYILIGT